LREVWHRCYSFSMTPQTSLEYAVTALRLAEMERDRAWAEVDGATYDQASRRHAASRKVETAWGDYATALRLQRALQEA
jgi:hypothetical protein